MLKLGAYNVGVVLDTTRDPGTPPMVFPLLIFSDARSAGFLIVTFEKTLPAVG